MRMRHYIKELFVISGLVGSVNVNLVFASLLLQTCRGSHGVGGANLRHGPKEALAGARPRGRNTTYIDRTAASPL